MEYIETYFRIKNNYQGYTGFSSEQEANAFRAETRSLFASAGWNVQQSTQSGHSDTVSHGLERLYLHPMSFSGELLPDSIPEVRSLLSQAKRFSCYAVDCYKTYLDISDAEYLSRLEEQRESIRQDLLDACRTKRCNLYFTGDDVHNRIVNKYTIYRIAERDKRGSLAGPFVSQMFDELVAQGFILLAKTRYGTGFRTATDKDLKKAG